MEKVLLKKVLPTKAVLKRIRFQKLNWYFLKKYKNSSFNKDSFKQVIFKGCVIVKMSNNSQLILPDQFELKNKDIFLLSIILELTSRNRCVHSKKF